MSHHFLKDNDSVYFFYDKKLTKLEDSDPDSFEWLEIDLAKDINNIYQVREEIDPAYIYSRSIKEK